MDKPRTLKLSFPELLRERAIEIRTYNFVLHRNFFEWNVDLTVERREDEYSPWERKEKFWHYAYGRSMISSTAYSIDYDNDKGLWNVYVNIAGTEDAIHIFFKTRENAARVALIMEDYAFNMNFDFSGGQKKGGSEDAAHNAV